MIPKRVVLQNFLSFGDDPVAFEFDADEPLWVLCGPNGVGKSSVFDAITYALFGCHRGGKGQGMDKLVRHGTNGFRVEFEFAFAGRDYRVTRDYGKKSVERVYVGGEEVDLPTGKNKVRDWIEQQLGLTYEQFTASVLLKQGEADRIITGTGKERLAMLKTIIGVERFEGLAGKVSEAAKAAKAEQKRLADDLQKLPPVTDEELTAAGERAAAAETKFHQAQEAEGEAATRVGQAAQFEKLERARVQLEGFVRAADERRTRAADILAKYARLTELDAVVPTLKSVTAARDALAAMEPRQSELRERVRDLAAAVERLTSARDAAKADADKHDAEVAALLAAHKETKAELTAAIESMAIANDVEEIDRQLAAVPADVDALVDAASEARDAAEDAVTRATEGRSACQQQLRDRKKELTAFDDVEIGATCSRCRQPVGKDHAEKERAFLAGEIQRVQQELRQAEAAEKDATTRRNAAKTAHEKNTALKNTKNTLHARRLGLVRHGEVPSVAAVQARLTAAQDKLDEIEVAGKEERGKAESRRAAAKTFETDRATAEADRKAAKDDLDDLDRDHLRTDTQLTTLAGTLPRDWAARWAALAADEVRALDRERDSLKRSDVTTQHQHLQDDAARRAEWERQLADTRDGIGQVPAAARVPVPAAEQSHKAARQATKDAATAATHAADALKELTKRIERRAELVAAERAAEKAARLHGKLHDHLGPEGLQRDLVRSAERQIVKYANETVRNLSDGDLAIELDDAEDGPDKAFTLKVRRLDSEPIGVNYLSGSQRFRVAVAVALAIGRFATNGTQARPLESVIIDEGFGSLDKDGLRAMGDELKRLGQVLKRIILVSHQVEFTNDFRARYQLHKADGGTRAEKVRR